MKEMNELQNLAEQNREAMDKALAAAKELDETCEKVFVSLYKEPVVRIYNNQQAYQYMAHGVKPIDFYPDTQNKRIVFVFRKAETKELYAKWRNREL